MNAPMIVTNWINMQYYASVVDNKRYGSGNKTLHNVTGDRIGVFEGNGGDLRIGLPWQSLHDGERWSHTPLRLIVAIEAPRKAIETVIAKHEMVQQSLAVPAAAGWRPNGNLSKWRLAHWLVSVQKRILVNHLRFYLRNIM